MSRIEDLKVEKRYERLTPTSEEESKALENLILGDGEIHTPIIVWMGHNIVVDGHSRVKILKKHPQLKYSIKEIEFEDWQEVQVWIVEHHIARKSFTLWQKLEMAINCIPYWETKELAKQNRGKRTDLMSPSDKKPDSIDMNSIIAEKVGCCRTYVTYFMNIFYSPNERIKQKCREGSMSIKKAYETLNPTENKDGKGENNKNDGDKSLNLEIVSDDILSKCQKNQNLEQKNDIKIPDPKPIAEKMTSSKTSEGSVWFAICPIDAVIQIFKKSIDQDKGVIHIEVNNFSCKPVSKENGVTILEVCYLDGSTEEVSQKNDIDFEESKNGKR